MVGLMECEGTRRWVRDCVSCAHRIAIIGKTKFLDAGKYLWPKLLWYINVCCNRSMCSEVVGQGREIWEDSLGVRLQPDLKKNRTLVSWHNLRANSGHRLGLCKGKWKSLGACWKKWLWCYLRSVVRRAFDFNRGEASMWCQKAWVRCLKDEDQSM